MECMQRHSLFSGCLQASDLALLESDAKGNMQFNKIQSEFSAFFKMEREVEF